MKSIPTAKQITFLYFSIVAFAIIAIHASVFELTTEDIEQIYAQKRLENVEGFLMAEIKALGVSASSLNQKHLDNLNLRIRTEVDPDAKVYLDKRSMPDALKQEAVPDFGLSEEVITENDSKAFFFSKMPIGPDQQEVFVVLDNSLYELSEEELFASHFKQIMVSISLLFLSLWVVLKISDRLTKPFSTLKGILEDKKAEDLSPIEAPAGVMTQELMALIDTLNRYQSRVDTAIQRERSFNRYVSHELRSPLMVMKGAIQLLSHSSEAEFIAKQQARLSKATHEMQEFIETLLELTKTESLQQTKRPIPEQEIVSVIENQTFLIKAKPVKWQLEYISAPHLMVSEAVFQILVGNLIKNAFAYTDEGNIIVKVSSDELTVSDTGSGLSDQPSDEGYGLGLLLVRDICHRFHFNFELSNKPEGGCLARIAFYPTPTSDN